LYGLYGGNDEGAIKAAGAGLINLASNHLLLNDKKQKRIESSERLFRTWKKERSFISSDVFVSYKTTELFKGVFLSFI